MPDKEGAGVNYDLSRFSETQRKKDEADRKKAWSRTRDELIREMKELGFDVSLGYAVARQLGSTKAMERMLSYLHYVKPGKEELVVDEMLAICSDIAAWREKKASEKANAAYNYLLNYGLDTDSDD